MPNLTSDEAFKRSQNSWLHNNKNYQAIFADFEKSLESQIAAAIKLGYTSCEHTALIDDDGSNKSMIWAKLEDIAEKYEDAGYSTSISYKTSFSLFETFRRLYSDTPSKVRISIEVSWDDPYIGLGSMLD